jgi:hypothetical protein
MTAWTPGNARVDRDDLRVRDRAAHDLAVKHAGQPQMVDVLDGAGDLLHAFEAWYGTRDLAQRALDRLGGLRHG